MEEKKPAKKPEEEFSHIIRLANTDIQGEKKIINGLKNIPGVSFTFAHSICQLTGLDKNKKVGYLSDEEIQKLEAVLSDPLKAGFPSWLLNRQNDFETGQDLHLLASQVRFIRDNDIKRLNKIKSFRGLRLVRGLTVRGQRTKSNFRKNKGKVTGVQRKKARAAAAAAKPKEGGGKR